MNTKTEKRGWSPYLAGALVGVLAVLSVLVTTKIIGKPKYLGASTTFVRTAGLVEKQFAPEHVKKNEYFQAKKVKVDWQMMLVVGILLGALAASLSDGSFKLETVPPMWAERFGNSIPLRAVGAIAGGIIAMYGARLAGGCPSGHGLSGVMQLAVSSLVAMIFFLLGGMITAKIIYGRRK
jgi:uncharacterized membrane protein YedE/YeeE